MDTNTQPLKIILTYDILPGTGEVHYHFMVGRFVPLLQQLGFTDFQAWHTVYGDYPQRLVIFVAKNSQQVHALLISELWAELQQTLMQHVTNYQVRVLPAQTHFQY